MRRRSRRAGRPLPVHPPAAGSGNKVSPFSSLWPFSNQKKEDTGPIPSDADGATGSEEKTEKNSAAPEPQAAEPAASETDEKGERVLATLTPGRFCQILAAPKLL